MLSPALLMAAAAFVGGVLVAAQGPIYARLAGELGGNRATAVFLAFVVGAVASGAAMLATGGQRTLTMTGIVSVPAWVWLGGVLGAVHVAISMQAIPVLGASAFLAMVVLGTLVGGAVYDQVGEFGLEARPVAPQRALGLALVALGAWLAVAR